MKNTSKAMAQFLRTIVSNRFHLDSETLYKGEGEYVAKVNEGIIDTEESLRCNFVRFAKICSNCH